jgi:UDP-glucose 4-epimerase
MSEAAIRPVAWVVGRGGLLGSNTAPAVARRAELWNPAEAVRWGEPGVLDQIRHAVQEFADHAGGRPWWVTWCAGVGVVASDPAALELETAVLECLLDELAAAQAAQRLRDGLLFFSSSAGGVYAGSENPPFDEHTVPRPLVAYGVTKLVQEELVRAWSATSGVPSLIGRIANLYGPGQDLAKPQGLISQLCWSQLHHRPLNVYVPLATLRDYVYAPDCGTMIARALDDLGRRTDRAGTATIAVMASGRPLSIGAVIGEFRRLLRRNARVSLRSSPLGRAQVIDLRLASRSPLRLARHATTPFPVGLHVTYHDLMTRYAAGTAA